LLSRETGKGRGFGPKDKALFVPMAGKVEKGESLSNEELAACRSRNDSKFPELGPAGALLQTAAGNCPQTAELTLTGAGWTGTHLFIGGKLWAAGLPYLKLGKGFLIDRADLDKWNNARKVRS
jgi:hypothetical protein